MGIIQAYRSTASNRNVELIEDFSGGMNTTIENGDISEKEARLIDNLILGTRGALSTRPGFRKQTYTEAEQEVVIVSAKEYFDAEFPEEDLYPLEGEIQGFARFEFLVDGDPYIPPYFLDTGLEVLNGDLTDYYMIIKNGEIIMGVKIPETDKHPLQFIWVNLSRRSLFKEDTANFKADLYSPTADSLVTLTRNPTENPGPSIEGLGFGEINTPDGAISQRVGKSEIIIVHNKLNSPTNIGSTDVCVGSSCVQSNSNKRWGATGTANGSDVGIGAGFTAGRGTHTIEVNRSFQGWTLCWIKDNTTNKYWVGEYLSAGNIMNIVLGSKSSVPHFAIKQKDQWHGIWEIRAVNFATGGTIGNPIPMLYEETYNASTTRYEYNRKFPSTLSPILPPIGNIPADLTFYKRQTDGNYRTVVTRANYISGDPNYGNLEDWFQGLWRWCGQTCGNPIPDWFYSGWASQAMVDEENTIEGDEIPGTSNIQYYTMHEIIWTDGTDEMNGKIKIKNVLQEDDETVLDAWLSVEENDPGEYYIELVYTEEEAEIWEFQNKEIITVDKLTTAAPTIQNENPVDILAVETTITSQYEDEEGDLVIYNKRLNSVVIFSGDEQDVEEDIEDAVAQAGGILLLGEGDTFKTSDDDTDFDYDLVVAEMPAYKPTIHEANELGLNGLDRFPGGFIKNNNRSNELQNLGITLDDYRVFPTKNIQINAWYDFNSVPEVEFAIAYLGQGLDLENAGGLDDGMKVVRTWGSVLNRTQKFDEIGVYRIRTRMREDSGDAEEDYRNAYITVEVKSEDETLKDQIIEQDYHQALSRCTKSIKHSNRLFVWGDTENPDILFFSDINRHNYYPLSYFLKIATDDAEPITGCVSYGGGLFIFTGKSVRVLEGSSPSIFSSNPFRINDIHKDIGCIAPYSIKVVQNYILFLSTEGVKALKQNFQIEDLGKMSLVSIDENIRDNLLKDVEHWSEARAVFYDRQYNLHINGVFYSFYPDFSKVTSANPNGVWVKNTLNSSEFVVASLFRNEYLMVKDSVGRVLKNSRYDVNPVYEDDDEDYWTDIITPRYYQKQPLHDKSYKKTGFEMTTRFGTEIELYLDTYIELKQVSFSTKIEHSIKEVNGVRTATSEFVDTANPSLRVAPITRFDEDNQIRHNWLLDESVFVDNPEFVTFVVEAKTTELGRYIYHRVRQKSKYQWSILRLLHHKIRVKKVKPRTLRSSRR